MRTKKVNVIKHKKIKSEPRKNKKIHEKVQKPGQTDKRANIYGEIVKNIPGGVNLFRMSDGIIVFNNLKFEKMFGYGPGEIVGKHISVLQDPAHKKITKNIMDVLLRTGEWYGEVNNIKKDGTPFWCHMNISTFNHPDYGKVLISVNTDITERKYAAENLKRINECLLNLTSDYDRNIQLLTALCGKLLNADFALYNRLDGNLLCLKGQWNAPPDIKLEDAPQGHICFDVIKHKSESPLIIPHILKTEYARTDPNILKYGLQTYVGFSVRFGGIIRGSICVVYTHEYKTTDNELLSMGIIATAIGQEEERRRAEETLRESEECYRTLVETINLAVCLIDKNHRLITVNNAYCKMFGVAKAGLKGKHCFEICLKNNSVCPDCPGTKTMVMKKAVKMEKEYLFGDGTYLPVIIHTYPVFDSYNNVKAFIKIMEDASENKKIEQAKKNMIRDISHSLKNPIAMTEMAFEIATNSINTGDKESLVRANKIASENLKKLRKDVNNILQEFSIDINSDVIVKEKSASLKAAVMEAADEIRLLIEEKSLQLNTNLALNLDNVKIDKRDLKTIINNLLDNAVKFTKKGKISVIGRLKDEMVEIEVKDTGCGISPKDIKMVFEKFYKRHASIDGTGLGLPICKELAAMYNGEINIYSEGVGKGSTVVVRLPAS